jgi:hypothetical protein
LCTDTGGHLYETFNTFGVSKNDVRALGFSSYYMTSGIDKSVDSMDDRRRYWRRNSDMVRLRGLQVSTRMIIKAKSGFRVRMIVFQTPYNMGQILGDASIPDNRHEDADDDVIQGRFNCNAQIMTTVVKSDTGEIQQSYINDKFHNLFDKQVRIAQHTKLHDHMMTMKVTHPNVFVLSDKKRFFCNRSRDVKTFKWNVFRKLFTTIKYPPTVYGPFIEKGPFAYQEPDRKIFVMFIVTPATEQMEFPSGLQYPSFSIGVHDDPRHSDRLLYDDGDSRWLAAPNDRRVSEEPDQGAPYSETLFTEGPSMPKIPEGQDDQEDVEEEGGGTGPGAGTGPETRSKGKARAASAGLGSSGFGGFGGDVPDPSDPPRVEELKDAFKQALAENRDDARREREREKKDRDRQGRPKPPGVEYELTERWAEEQGMLLQPTLSMWWKEMPKAMLNPSRRRFPGYSARRFRK